MPEKSAYKIIYHFYHFFILIQVEADLAQQVELVEREDMTFHASRPGYIID